MKPCKLALLCAALVLAMVSLGCNKLKARDRLNKGVAAFRNAQFQQAIVHFKTAVDLDPTLLNARLYLAVAYSQLYIPGGESEENIKVAKQAIETFEQVVKLDPGNTTAIASIAQIYYNMREFEKSKEYQRRRMQIEPNNPEPHYWIGVIDWAVCYPRRMQLRKELDLVTPKDIDNPMVLPPLPERDRTTLATENMPLIEEGIKALQTAIELKPNDSDAMTYLNLMYRERADLQAGPDAREADLKQADDFIEKALGIRKMAAEKAAAAVR